ncbi:MAG: histidine phosphatase family protein [Treponema sp.]|nr:histidine phosphatase family protein [Candidatus Treponema merdequi]
MGKLYFVRHGQSQWNVENKICGATDIPLTDFGREQASLTADQIINQKIIADEILCSPLSRAKETAQIISEKTHIPLREEQALFEQNFGHYEGTPRDSQEFRQAKKNFLCRYGTGESMFQLAQRIYNLLDKIKSEDKTYILVAHNGIARIIQSYFYEMTNDEFADFGIKNCEIKTYVWS